MSNITDIDDKIINKSLHDGTDWREVVAVNEAQWYEGMDALGIDRPDADPHATAYVDGMVALIERLVAAGKAYETSDGVYLDTSTVPGYGLLAGQPLESLRSGARIEANDEKRSPLDFVLWKKAKPDEPTWDSPWGPGRPGWHTECVVMSLDLLGEGFDIHGGGQDLRFPHHENERAQAIADGHTFASLWFHTGMLEMDGEKMSKSLGNVRNVLDLLEHYDARAYRLLVLRSHYRTPMDVSDDALKDAEAALARLDSFARRFASRVDGASPDAAVLDKFRAAMDDDLSTPAAMALLFDAVRAAQRRRRRRRRGRRLPDRHRRRPRPARRRRRRGRRVRPRPPARRGAAGEGLGCRRCAARRPRGPRLRGQRRPRRHGDPQALRGRGA